MTQDAPSATPRMSPDLDAGTPSSPFFAIAANMMAVVNLLLGTLCGIFALPEGVTTVYSVGYVAAYAVGAAILVPLLIVGAVRLAGKARRRQQAQKIFFFLSVALFPFLVVALTANVVERLNLVRRDIEATVELRSESLRAPDMLAVTPKNNR